MYNSVIITALHHHPRSQTSTREPSKARPRAVLRVDDHVLLTGGIGCWIVRVGDLATLEARRDETLIRFASNEVLIRRSLEYCERRLDPSVFFRASRGCIVNIAQLRQPRLKDGCLIFRLQDGREIAFSRRQTVAFRAACGL